MGECGGLLTCLHSWFGSGLGLGLELGLGLVVHDKGDYYSRYTWAVRPYLMMMIIIIIRRTNVLLIEKKRESYINGMVSWIYVHGKR